jgi:hypothetical protein
MRIDENGKGTSTSRLTDIQDKPKLFYFVEFLKSTNKCPKKEMLISRNL